MHAAEEMFSLHAPIGNARYFIISDVSGDTRGGGGPNPAGDLLVVMDMAEDAATELGVK